MIESIPFFESYDKITKHLTLRGATYCPEELLIYASQVEILDLSCGSLSVLPTWFSRLEKLQVAFFSQNSFTILPEVLKECVSLRVLGFKSCQLRNIPYSALPKNLQWLILTDNRLQELPESMGTLLKLRKLALAGNQLRSLPETMRNCSSLELLRLGANQFDNPPDRWLFELPALAWYGDSGNSFNIARRPTSLRKPISYHDLEFKEQIGASPTSAVFRGVLKSTGKSVAIKQYRSVLTSDGYAADDVATYLGLNNHPHLIHALGEVNDLPSHQRGLVLQLIPSEYRALGKPPSLESCTRDTFETGTTFSIGFIENVLNDIASAIQYLHENRISHGDIYAHNILSDSNGRSILGDFGAASHFESMESEHRIALEVRAFGHLIDDLLNQCQARSAQVKIKKFQAVRDVCLGANACHGPTMDEVRKRLSAIIISDLAAQDTGGITSK